MPVAIAIQASPTSQGFKRATVYGFKRGAVAYSSLVRRGHACPNSNPIGAQGKGDGPRIHGERFEVARRWWCVRESQEEIWRHEKMPC